MAKATRVRVVHPTVPHPVATEGTVVEDTPQDFRKKEAIFRTYQVLWYILGVIETLLLLRFLFKVLGASTASPFVMFLYDLSGVFVAPFAGMFRVETYGQSAIEWSALIAMLMYALITYGIVYLFQLIKPTDAGEVEETVENP